MKSEYDKCLYYGFIKTVAVKIYGFQIIMDG